MRSSGATRKGKADNCGFSGIALLTERMDAKKHFSGNIGPALRTDHEHMALPNEPEVVESGALSPRYMGR